MTALIASSDIPDSSNIKIATEDLRPDGDSNLVVGDNWRASDLRDFTLLTSSNDGAFALAGAAGAKVASNTNDSHAKFIKSMNDKAREIGLLNTKFFNEHGLDTETDRGGAYGSALDMALLFEYTLKNYPQILEATRYKSLQFASANKVYSADNTNIAVDQIPSLLASKTGYTDLAGGNLVIAFDAGLNRPIIISILGSTQEGRFTDALKLVNASLKYIHDN
jgi:D-alanyl-D-alanine carboxypeptidase